MGNVWDLPKFYIIATYRQMYVLINAKSTLNYLSRLCAVVRLEVIFLKVSEFAVDCASKRRIVWTPCGLDSLRDDVSLMSQRQNPFLRGRPFDF